MELFKEICSHIGAGVIGGASGLAIFHAVKWATNEFGTGPRH